MRATPTQCCIAAHIHCKPTFSAIYTLHPPSQDSFSLPLKGPVYCTQWLLEATTAICIK